jgi:hypothetical protein
MPRLDEKHIMIWECEGGAVRKDGGRRLDVRTAETRSDDSANRARRSPTATRTASSVARRRPPTGAPQSRRREGRDGARRGRSYLHRLAPGASGVHLHRASRERRRGSSSRSSASPRDPAVNHAVALTGRHRELPQRHRPAVGGVVGGAVARALLVAAARGATGGAVAAAVAMLVRYDHALLLGSLVAVTLFIHHVVAAAWGTGAFRMRRPGSTGNWSRRTRARALPKVRRGRAAGAFVNMVGVFREVATAARGRERSSLRPDLGAGGRPD